MAHLAPPFGPFQCSVTMLSGSLPPSAGVAAKAGAKVGLYIGVPYNVSAQGTFPQVLAFLRRLETGRHFSRFTTVTFDKATGADAGAGLITVTIAVELLGLP